MPTIQNAIDEFFLDQRIKGNSPKTIKYYQCAFNAFARFHSAENPLESIDLPLLRKYAVELQNCPLNSVSRQSYIRALRAFLSWCYAQELLPVDYSQKFRLPKAKREVIHVLTDDEAKRLLSSFNTRSTLQLRNYCICALMLDSGLRLDEVASLRVENLHLQEGYAIVDGKGNKQRSVPLGMQGRKALAGYLRRRPAPYPTDTGLVFLRSNGNPISQTTVKNLFRKLKKKLGIPRLHAHLLRHTFATNYLENGGDLYTLQQILGHTSLEMVRRYVHLTQRKTAVKFPEFSPLDRLSR